MTTEKKQAVALSSVYASALLSVAKLVVGLLTGSLGVLSEAVHSMLDLLAASLTWLAVRVSDKPADETHHYGHGKVESVSALIETGLLFLTSFGIIYEAIKRLFFAEAPVDVTWSAVGVISMSIIVDFSRSRALMKVAKETRSQALEADALHFSSDILSSAAVLVGLGGVAAGFAQADAIAALVVALVVFHAGYDLGRRTIDVLIDAAPVGQAELVRKIVYEHKDVAGVERLRIRPAGSLTFIDLSVRISRTLAMEQGTEICEAISRRIREEIPEAEPSVYAEPIQLCNESVLETVQVIARNYSLSLHDVGVLKFGDRYQVSYDLEVDEDSTIGEAHKVATNLEKAIRAKLGAEVSVDTHIDPRRMRVLTGDPIDAQQTAEIIKKIRELAQSLRSPIEVHNIKVRGEAGGVYLSCHCIFNEQTPIRNCHDQTLRLEALLWENIPKIDRILLHAEPSNHEDDPVDRVID
ncbi:ferrous-iron efflux pump FieF [Azospirillaceae bacterium]